jgi:hypothetical protein
VAAKPVSPQTTRPIAGHPGGAADQHDVVDVRQGDPAVRDGPLDGSGAAFRDAPGDGFEFVPGDRLVRVKGTARCRPRYGSRMSAMPLADSSTFAEAGSASDMLVFTVTTSSAAIGSPGYGVAKAQRGPVAFANRRSSVASFASSDSASATYQPSYAVTFSRSSHTLVANGS